MAFGEDWGVGRLPPMDYAVLQELLWEKVCRKRNHPSRVTDQCSIGTKWEEDGFRAGVSGKVAVSHGD